MNQQAPRTFSEIPYPDDVCRVRGPGCLAQVTFRIYCRIEGTELRACQMCYSKWQDKAHRYGLHDRCPVCTAGTVRPLPLVVPPLPLPAPPIPLSGDAARAIESAMHHEGVPLDIRQHVMSRLHREAFWLSYVHPEVVSQTSVFMDAG